MEQPDISNVLSMSSLSIDTDVDREVNIAMTVNELHSFNPF